MIGWFWNVIRGVLHTMAFIWLMPVYQRSGCSSYISAVAVRKTDGYFLAKWVLPLRICRFWKHPSSSTRWPICCLRGSSSSLLRGMLGGIGEVVIAVRTRFSVSQDGEYLATSIGAQVMVGACINLLERWAWRGHAVWKALILSTAVAVAVAVNRSRGSGTDWLGLVGGLNTERMFRLVVDSGKTKWCLHFVFL